ncbi:uncharacterized protein [Nicotiana sylvestris]|uniref:uncharacterized protein n=1 Tax=Nicotiana sylvestris TaxID=4096 RepID=UPI00388C4C06
MATNIFVTNADGVNNAITILKFQCLLRGHNLYGHLDVSIPAPTRTISQNNQDLDNPAFVPWYRQDQLIQNAILASADPILAPTIAVVVSAKAAWDALHTAYANKSQTRIFSLRDRLARLTKDSRPVTDYLHQVRSICDELATAGAPVSNAELIVKILSGLGFEFRELSSAIRARDSTISYEELYEKLLDHELFLKHEEDKKPLSTPITAVVAQKTTPTPPRQGNNPNSSNRRPGPNAPANNQQWQTQPWHPRRNNQRRPFDKNLRCQLCDRVGHSARVCRSQSHDHLQARANFAARLSPQQTSWIMDSGATHHIASDAQSLTTVHDYRGTEEIIMGNGNTIPISHTGSSNISASNYNFKLLNTLCSLAIKSNLIFVSEFSRDNHSSIEFFPFHYLVKDLSIGASLVRGQNKDGLYEWPPGCAHRPPQCNVILKLVPFIIPVIQIKCTGFIKSQSDSSLFIMHNSEFTAYILVYVDDIIVTGNQIRGVQSIIENLATRFSLKDLGQLHYSLVFEVFSYSGSLLLSQQKYITDLLQEVNMHNCKGVPKSMASTVIFPESAEDYLVDGSLYRQIIVAAIIFGIVVVTHSHYIYLASATHQTSSFGLRIAKERDHRLLAYSDSDWAEDPLDRTSTTGYVVYLDSSPISWSSKKQRSVSRSSTEAEYRVVAATVSETNWLRSLLNELRFHISATPQIFCDNVSTTYICANPVFHSRMKHIAIDFHFVREQVQNKEIEVQHLHSANQVADILTKPLPRASFVKQFSKLGVVDTTNLRGRNNG